jgi:hypothetical protein
MGKDLRTTAVHMKLGKYPKLDTSVWDIKNPQPFFPSLEKLFKTESISNLPEYGVRLQESIDTIIDRDHIRTNKNRVVPIHRKTTTILSHFKWMRGDYGVLGLPKPIETAEDMQESIQSPHSAGYVGALASICLSESGCQHFPRVYGVYIGIASRHEINISDDYEILSERRWFADNIGKSFELRLRTPEDKPAVQLGEQITLDDIQDIEADHVSEPDSGSHTDVEEEEEESDDEDEFEIRSCSCASDDSDDEEDDDEEEEPFAWAIFKDIPVITTVMEKCEGTFYELLHNNPEQEKHAAWTAQLVFGLAYAQRNFGLTHNDLHANNVMYVKTDQEFLHYKHNGLTYRVPTYGYLIKIIDFDRACFSVRLVGMKDPKQFVSSQFKINEEAAGQYNTDPFFEHKYPHIHPNPSFDLCRFATSLFWDMFPEGPTHDYTHPLFGVFKQWMTQSDGTSVMFRKEGDNHDRYHGFHLYKAIARYCKESAVPRREISKLTVYQITQCPLGTPCLFIES